MGGFQIVDDILSCVFATEIMLKIFAWRSAFFCGPEKYWNYFDCVVVGLQMIAQLMMAMASGVTGVDAVRFFRLLRLVRVLRIAKMIAVFQELHTLVVSIAASMKSLGSVVTLMFLFTYTIGVYLTQIVTEHKLEHFKTPSDVEEASNEEKENMDELNKYYGTLSRSMLSLFETITEGIHWSEIMEPIAKDCSIWLTIVFVVYMFFAIFLLMNVVTGLFCSSAMETAEMTRKKNLMQQMCQMFVHLDDDGSGIVTWDEFSHHLQNPRMMSYLRAIDIDPTEAGKLFSLLDADESGGLEAEELVSGCLRLHGNAKALELAALMHQFTEFNRQWTAHARRVERHMSIGASSSRLFA